MALRIAPQLKTIISHLASDEEAVFTPLLALSSEGLAVGAVDSDGKPYWTISDDLKTFYERTANISSLGRSM
jgi:hypothetical protein